MLDAALLLVRTTTGLVVGGFGLQKLFRWFPTEIRDEAVGSFGSRATFRSVIGAAQVLAGVLLVLGVWPFGSSLTFAAAIAGFLSRRWSLALWGNCHRAIPVLLALVAVSFIFVGPGRYSAARIYLDETASRTSDGRATAETARTNFCGAASLKAIAKRPNGTALCTHGKDPEDAVGAIITERDIVSVSPAPCPGDGRTGNRVQVLYGVPQGQTSDFAGKVGTVRKKVAYANHYLRASSGRTQDVRWLCNKRGKVAVRSVRTIAIRDSFTLDQRGNCVLDRTGDSSFTFRDMVCSLTNQTQLGLGSVNYDRTDRIYLVFMDRIADAYGKSYCGQGNLQNDDRPGADNLNNRGPSYSLIACWDGTVALHELGHNMGAVQLSAKHSSGGFHCFDEHDTMCYADGGSYFNAGGLLRVNCLTTQWWHFDCGRNDYYAPRPSSGSYLATHWNVANSSFLTSR